MPAKKFIIPFASTGDRAPVPDALQPSGSVSYAQGFGPDYELDKAINPVNAKDVPRDQTNQIYFDLTDAVGEQQLYGAALWGADRAPYPINAQAYHDGKLWRSSIANNNGVPGVAGWADVSGSALQAANNLSDLANVSTARSNLGLGTAATATLTTSATDATTGRVTKVGDFGLGLLTGAPLISLDSTTTATGFYRWAAGDGTPPAGNVGNAVVLLQRLDSNISTQTFINVRGIATPVRIWIRTSSTANVWGGWVELATTDSLIGVGQTWQDVTGSRVKGTTYTNSTGRPIQILVQYQDDAISGVGATFNVGSLTRTTSDLTGGTSYPYWFSAVIPHGITYSISGGVTIPAWWELR